MIRDASMFLPALPEPPEQDSLPYLRVGLLLCPGFTLTPLASFVDTLRLAADREDRSRPIYFSWEFIAAGPAPIRASCGLEVVCPGSLDQPDRYDCIVVCGGLLRDLPQVSAKVRPFLRAASARRLPIVALCTGSFVLADCGLLDHSRCAMHFDVLAEFTRRFPNCEGVTDVNFIAEDNLITCPGSIVAIDVAAHLIARYGDASRARKALSYLLFNPENPPRAQRCKPWSQALAKASRLTVDAVQYMEYRLDSPCSISDLAAAMKTTRARLNRTLMQDLHLTPAAFWRNMRLHAAKELLQGRRRTITEIAYDVGFCDTAHFCRTFKKQVGLTPQEFRQQARAAA